MIIFHKIRFSSDGADLKIVDDVGIIEDNDRLLALAEVGSGEESLSFNLVSDTEAWLLTGHPDWNFKVIHIRRTDEVEPITIKRSSPFEHKFAIAAMGPGEENRTRWCVRRYQVEQNDDATIKITQDEISGLKVSVVYGDNHEVPLTPSGDLIMFDQVEMQGRRRRVTHAIGYALTMGLGVGGIVATIASAQ